MKCTPSNWDLVSFLTFIINYHRVLDLLLICNVLFRENEA